MNARYLAAKIVYQVAVKKQSFTKTLQDQKALGNNKNHAFIQEISYGTLRWYHQLTTVLQQLLHSSLKAKDQDVLCLLLVGLYQLAFSKKPSYAIIYETVAATNNLRKSWAKGLVNKILRRFYEERESILESIQQNETAYYSHPSWMIAKIKQDWPNHWKAILTANNSRPPLTIRVNRLKISREDYLILLEKANITAKPIIGLAHAIQLLKPIAVEKLPGFGDGLCSVQDGAGQKITELLHLQPHHRILDACAAPGSKTTHILETVPSVCYFAAIDKDSLRLTKIKDNIKRLGLLDDQLHLVVADASHTQQWWDGKKFDRILLDTPCTASGTIRRHPDIKILREPEDVKSLAQQQLHLLKSLWPLLNDGGELLYTTCSIFNEENENIINQFLCEQNDAIVVPITINWGIALKHGRQLLPGDHNMDGFYYALLEKNEPL